MDHIENIELVEIEDNAIGADVMDRAEAVNTGKKKRTGAPYGLVLGLVLALVILGIILGVLFSEQLLTALGTLRSQPKTVACLGDSITYGAGVDEDRETLAWPAVLGSMLGSDYTVVNYGQNGATLQAEGDRPYRDTGFLEEALERRAGTYILMLGANDSKAMNWNRERYARELDEMVQTLTSGHWKHQVVLLQSPKAFPDEQTGQIKADLQDDVIREEIDPIIAETAQRYGLTCVDLYTLTQAHPEWYSDGIHPNVEGNRQIAALIYDAVWESVYPAS